MTKKSIPIRRPIGVDAKADKAKQENISKTDASGDPQVGKCTRCGRMLKSDDVALYRKLRDRTAPISVCCCRYCLAAHFHCTPTLMEEKIRQFKENGCTLFGLPTETT